MTERAFSRSRGDNPGPMQDYRDLFKKDPLVALCWHGLAQQQVDRIGTGAPHDFCEDAATHGTLALTHLIERLLADADSFGKVRRPLIFAL